MPPAKKKTVAEPIVLRRIEDERVAIGIVGITPVIPHRWSEKSLDAMRDKHMGQARRKPGPKNAEEDARSSCYWLDEECTRPGMPATAFKGAMVSACRFFAAPSMVEAKTLFYVEGVGVDQLVELDGDGIMREDTPRNSTGVVDLRYRMMFFPWSAHLNVRFPKGYISAESVLALLDAAGRVGVGDWRPGSPKSNTGTYGTFRVV
jgi:hypothetical protein